MENKSKNKTTVLLIEKDKTILSSFRELLPYHDDLSGRKFEFFVENLEDGLSVLRNVKIDIFITNIDFGIRDYNGIDAAKLASIINPETKIVFFHDLGNINIGFESDFTEIKKPIASENLLKELYKINNARRLQKIPTGMAAAA